MFTNELQNIHSKARIVDGALVLSLSDAKSPIVWRMDLKNLREAAFQLVEENSDYLLVVRTDDGQVKDIARYETREGGQRALLLATEAFMEGTPSQSDKENKSFLRSVIDFPVGNLLRWVFFFILLFLLLIAVMLMLNPNTNTMQQMQMPEQQQVLPTPPERTTRQPTTPDSRLESGEPVDVDELFGQ